MLQPSPDRRKYLRARIPLTIRVISNDNVIHQATTKDISPIGLRFESSQKGININDEVELKIEIPDALSPVHAKAKAVWKKRLSTENGTPFDIGLEFTKVEEDNKNTFLKYFCDLLYERSKEETGGAM